MQRIHSAVVQGPTRTFALVSVRPWVLDDPDARIDAARRAESELGCPIALVARDPGAKPRIWAHRKDMRALEDRDLSSLDWRTYSVASSSRPNQVQFHAACAGTGKRACPTCEGRGYVAGPAGERKYCPGLCQSGFVKCQPCAGSGYY